jgi:glycosyltransferase involved in cell wall biosynthesis
MRERWIEETTRLGLSDRVKFLGRRPFPEAVATMQSADLFCFTSLRDTSGNVVLEALAAGVPVLCFDHQGGGDMVTSSCGVKLPVVSPKLAYKNWASAVQHLAADPELLLRLSEGATERAKDYLWSHNHDRINALYQELVSAEHSVSETLSYGMMQPNRELMVAGGGHAR